MNESKIEKILVDMVRDVGGRAYKWVSPGNGGVPDRIIFFPDGKIRLVEMKTKSGVLGKAQIIQKKRLQKLKQEVVVLRSREDVEDFIRRNT